MFEKPWFARTALLINIAGTFLLMYSFQASSSDFRLITRHNQDDDRNYSTGNAYAICVQDFTLAETDSRGGVRLGSPSCKDWVGATPTAVVTAERPAFARWGLRLTIIGFLMQLLVPISKAESIAEIQQQIRLLKKREKLLRIKEESRP